ncbi:fam-l protein [Plasmodium malariae]|uniref:Fam-l protein n=1 Tax=Plasmodium malariae TaxID=5858 RepID=A0A1D3JHQ0_PLAMA|nr:fam-l protein [Plasmodium malariae]SBT85893.1 fam-l protein [Plasmodium malariae]
MDEKFKLLFFIKIFMFTLLTWICIFYNDMCTINKPNGENNNNRKNVDIRTYRLLVKCTQDKDSSITVLKTRIPNNEVSKKKDRYTNEKGTSMKKIYLCESSRKYNEGHKQDKKSKSCIFETKKYSRLENKIFKELDYVNFLKNNREISHKTYKKVILKKYGLKIALPLFFFLLISVVLILDLEFSRTYSKFWLLEISGLENISALTTFLSNLYSYLEWMKASSVTVEASNHGKFVLGKLFGILIYFVPFFILGVIFISVVVYYHKKVKKYEKIKFSKR